MYILFHSIPLVLLIKLVAQNPLFSSLEYFAHFTLKQVDATLTVIDHISFTVVGRRKTPYLVGLGGRASDFFFI